MLANRHHIQSPVIYLFKDRVFAISESLLNLHSCNALLLLVKLKMHAGITLWNYPCCEELKSMFLLDQYSTTGYPLIGNFTHTSHMKDQATLMRFHTEQNLIWNYVPSKATFGFLTDVSYALLRTTVVRSISSTRTLSIFKYTYNSVALGCPSDMSKAWAPYIKILTPNLQDLFRCWRSSF